MEYRQIEEFPKYEIDKDGNVRITACQTSIGGAHLKRGKRAVTLRTDIGTRATRTVIALVDKAFPELIKGKFVQGCTNYKIEEDGNLYSIMTSKFMKPTVAKNGYKVTNIRRDDSTVKMVYIHRLVAEAHIEGHFEDAHVNHIDGNKLNNVVANLEWVTNSDNLKHAHRTGLMNSKLRPCIISKDGNTQKFDSLKAAKAVIEAETGTPMPNVGKLSQCAKKNGSGKLNRGMSSDVNPFLCRGYAVRYLEQEAQQEQ